MHCAHGVGTFAAKWVHLRQLKIAVQMRVGGRQPLRRAALIAAACTCCGDQLSYCRVGSYDHAAVRALAWAIGAPALIESEPSMPAEHQLRLPLVASAEYAAQLSNARDWLDHLDRDPAPLDAFLAEATRGGRVGKYFEALLEFWLREGGSGYELLARDLQVFESKAHTLGAFDFIVRHTERDAVEHWEVTVKYYLQRGNGTLRTAWVGPNRRDRLDVKMRHMATAQLPLSSTHHGRAALAQIGVDGPVISRAWFKGILFRPWRHLPSGDDELMYGGVISTEVPPGAATGQPRGLWLESRHFEAYAATTDPRLTRWVFRPRPDWISPARGVGAEVGMDREAAARRAISVNAPELWSRLEPDPLADEPQSWVEVSQIFVVPDGWLDTEEDVFANSSWGVNSPYGKNSRGELVN